MSSMDCLFEEYVKDKTANEEELLKAVLKRAIKFFVKNDVPSPEDAAQDFLIEVWSYISECRPINASFSGFLRNRLKSRAIDAFRSRDTDRRFASQALPVEFDDYGMESEGDALDRMEFTYRPQETPQPAIPSDSILIRDLSHLLLEGYTIADSASHLKVTPDGLYKILQRFREKNAT